MARAVPTSDVVLWVSQNPGAPGSDTTGDGSQGNPFATIQHAFDILYQGYDLNFQFAATIQLAAAPLGSYWYYNAGANLSGRVIGQAGSIRPLVIGPGKPSFPVGKYKPITLQGDPANPLGAFIVPPAGGGAGISLTDGAALRIQNLGIDTATSVQDCIDVFRATLEIAGGIRFGNAGPPPNSYCCHVAAGFESLVLVTGNYQIGGSALSHITVAEGSTLDFENNGGEGTPFQITLEQNGISFKQGFIAADANSIVYAAGVGFVNGNYAISTPTASVTKSSAIYTGTTGGPGGNNTGNPNAFPGDIDPIVDVSSFYE